MIKTLKQYVDKAEFDETGNRKRINEDAKTDAIIAHNSALNVSRVLFDVIKDINEKGIEFFNDEQYIYASGECSGSDLRGVTIWDAIADVSDEGEPYFFDIDDLAEIVSDQLKQKTKGSNRVIVDVENNKGEATITIAIRNNSWKMEFKFIFEEQREGPHEMSEYQYTFHPIKRNEWTVEMMFDESPCYC